jgi:AAA domain
MAPDKSKVKADEDTLDVLYGAAAIARYIRRPRQLCATTVASGKWTDDCVEALRGRDVYILQDVDENGAGEKKALAAAALLHPVCTSVKIIVLPGLTGAKDSKDVTNWLHDFGNTKEQLEDVCANAMYWIPPIANVPAVVAPALVPVVADRSPKPLIQTSAEFVARYVPPDYLVHGLLLEAFLYSLTGATGAGKTSITLRLAASVALGISFAGRDCKRRRVLYLAAENPVDIRMRWIALARQMDFDADTVDVYFVEGVFRISKMTAALRAEAERVGGEFGLVIIDTGPVFYEGDDENNRKQQGDHAEMLRGLIDVVPGKPAVLANVHPVKNAAPDNLLPAGGGSFLNQVDGNLTASKTDNTTELHWQGKFRGVEFAPMHFMLRSVTHETLKDSTDGLIPTVVCDWISDSAKDEIAKQKVTDEDLVLAIIAEDPQASQAMIANKMDWKLYSGEPHKTKAKRCVQALKAAKLIEETRRKLSRHGQRAEGTRRG